MAYFREVILLRPFLLVAAVILKFRPPDQRNFDNFYLTAGLFRQFVKASLFSDLMGKYATSQQNDLIFRHTDLVFMK